MMVYTDVQLLGQYIPVVLANPVLVAFPVAGLLYECHIMAA